MNINVFAASAGRVFFLLQYKRPQNINNGGKHAQNYSGITSAAGGGLIIVCAPNCKRGRKRGKQENE